MKKFKILAILISIVFMITACGSNKVINGKKYETFGLIGNALGDPTVASIKEPGIKYKIIWGNAILGVILVETIIAPIYFFGFSLFEPVGELPKDHK